MFGYDTLEGFMRTNWAMMQHHKYSLSDLENSIAWERQVYVMMTMMYLKEENERIKLERQAKR
jgi:hypothetical protein